MEEVGARVGLPIFLHDSMPSACCDRTLERKRGYFYRHSVSQQDTGNDWKPKSWQWDSSRFAVRLLESETLQPRMRQEENKRQDDSNKLLEWNSGRVGDVEHDDEDGLRLNLSGGKKYADEPASRPNKRIRSGSPGGNYPTCQVDDCNEDLSNVKDYHRRHKVCEVHSKSANALVGKQLKRFCQQCSRFHLLSEFDEGKRSCRSRLACHNRRRRKTQSEDVNSRLRGQGNQVRNENVDTVHLLQSLAHEQGTAKVNALSGLDKEQIVDFLGKINSLRLPVDLAAKFESNRNDSVASSGKSLLNHQDICNTKPLTADLLAALSSAQPAATTRSRESSDQERKNKSKSAAESVDTVQEMVPAVDRSSVGGEWSSASYQSLVEHSDGQIQQAPPSLQLQLFISSPEDDSPPKLASSEKYFSSEGSNPVEERSPSSSPVVHELFPMQSFQSRH